MIWEETITIHYFAHHMRAPVPVKWLIKSLLHINQKMYLTSLLQKKRSKRSQASRDARFSRWWVNGSSSSLLAFIVFPATTTAKEWAYSIANDAIHYSAKYDEPEEIEWHAVQQQSWKCNFCQKVERKIHEQDPISNCFSSSARLNEWYTDEDNMNNPQRRGDRDW